MRPLLLILNLKLAQRYFQFSVQFSCFYAFNHELRIRILLIIKKLKIQIHRNTTPKLTFIVFSLNHDHAYFLVSKWHNCTPLNGIIYAFHGSFTPFMVFRAVHAHDT